MAVALMKKQPVKKAVSKQAAKKATKSAVVKTTKTAASKNAATKKMAAKTRAKKAAAKKTIKPAAPRAAGASSPVNASERIDKKIASLADWRGERLAEIRKLIHEADPEVTEDWKWMGTPVWSHQGMYVLANPHKDKVKLTFFHGAQLSDPHKLFNAGLNGGKWRAIDIRANDKIDRAALKDLLREAVAYNATHAVAKSKGLRK